MSRKKMPCPAERWEHDARQWQAVYLAERLSEARILVNNDQCARCQKMSFEACKACWLEASAQAVREGRHAK